MLVGSKPWRAASLPLYRCRMASGSGLLLFCNDKHGVPSMAQLSPREAQPSRMQPGFLASRRVPCQSLNWPACHRFSMSQPGRCIWPPLIAAHQEAVDAGRPRCRAASTDLRAFCQLSMKLRANSGCPGGRGLRIEGAAALLHGGDVGHRTWQGAAPGIRFFSPGSHPLLSLLDEPRVYIASRS